MKDEDKIIDHYNFQPAEIVTLDAISMTISKNNNIDYLHFVVVFNTDAR